MIFADKLIQLRKKSGWSQEELAEQMGVSRQSISKWEGAQSIPDLEKIIRLAKLFSVSTDYLLLDEMGEPEGGAPALPGKDIPALRRISMEEANAFLKIKEETARYIAWGVFLCILSPIVLLMLGGFSEMPGSGISEGLAAAIGLTVLLMMVAAAVAIFVYSGGRTSPFEYLDSEFFETEYGVSSMVKERREQYRERYMRNNIIGVCLCILAAIPLFSSVALEVENPLLPVGLLCATLVIVSLGVRLLVHSGTVWGGFERLLEEGEYTREEKKKQPLISRISQVYWLLVLTGFLAYSFVTGGWDRSWIVWPVAAVLFPAVTALILLFAKKNNGENPNK